MAKRPPPGKCVHCLQHFEELTWDHVFPESWYPKSSPQDIEKWKIPSCLRCNREYGKMEDDLLIRLGLCINPQDPRSEGIAQKALRALKGEFGKNKKDKKIREAKRNKILRESLFGKEIPTQGIFPNFEGLASQKEDDRIGITIKESSFRKLTEKIIRGINYIDNQIFIERPYSIESFVLTDEGAEPIIATLNKFGKEYAKEPGIKVMRAVAPEDGLSSIYSIEIWGHLKTYGAVIAE